MWTAFGYSQVGQSIMRAMETECRGENSNDPEAGLTEQEYVELMVSLEDTLRALVADEEAAAKEAGAR